MTQAEFTTAAPHQLPCTPANNNSLHQTQQSIQNSPNCIPELPNQSLMPPVDSVEPCPSLLGEHCTNNNDCLDQLLTKIQALSTNFQNLSTTLSLLISWQPSPDKLTCIQLQVYCIPWVNQPTPDISHPILIFDLTTMQGHLPISTAHWPNSIHWPYIDPPSHCSSI